MRVLERELPAMILLRGSGWQDLYIHLRVGHELWLRADSSFEFVVQDLCFIRVELEPNLGGLVSHLP